MTSLFASKYREPFCHTCYRRHLDVGAEGRGRGTAFRLPGYTKTRLTWGDADPERVRAGAYWVPHAASPHPTQDDPLRPRALQDKERRSRARRAETNRIAARYRDRYAGRGCYSRRDGERRGSEFQYGVARMRRRIRPAGRGLGQRCTVPRVRSSARERCTATTMHLNMK